MSFAMNFPLFCVVLSLISSVVSSVLPGKAARRLSLCLFTLVTVLNAFVLAEAVQTGEVVTYIMGHYTRPWGNEIRIGILEPLFAMAFSFVLLLCVVGGARQLRGDLQPEKANLYYVLTDLIQAALLVLVYTNDIFTGYVFIEICTIASCGILMIRQVGRTTLASVRYMIFSLVGSGLFLFGVILLYNVTGHLLMPNIKETVAALWESGQYRVPLTTAICLITVGLGIKSGLFPFHLWMPDTYSYGTPSSSGILSGLVSKGYIFLLIKCIYSVFSTDVFYASGLHNVLYAFGILGIIMGSVSAIRENDIFRMTAYSSAAQIGYIYMGIGLSPVYGVAAALFHVLTHAVTKPALFLAAAQLTDMVAGRSKKFRDLQGAAHVHRSAGASFAVGCLSMIGVPLTMGFISKYLFAVAGFHANVKLIPTLVVLAVSTILNTFYFGRTLIRLYSEPEKELRPPVRFHENRSYTVAAVLFMAANVVLGVWTQPLVSLLERGLQIF